VTTEQHAAGLAAGIPWNANAVCFLHGVADGGGEERQALEQKERAGALTAAEAARLQAARRAYESVPDDPNFLVGAGVGFETFWYDKSISSFKSISSDPSMPPTWRCDAAVGIVLEHPDDPNGPRINVTGEGHAPFGLNRRSTSWYRLPAGKGLPTAPPGKYHCGTPYTGWLSGWPVDADGQPDSSYNIPADGLLPPPVGSPPAAGTVCFDGGGSFGTCRYHTEVRAVSCGAFTLWELPPAPSEGKCFGYCLAPDRCADCAAAGRCAAGSWAGFQPGTTCVNDDFGGNHDREGLSCKAYHGADRCGQHDDDDFTAATQCCACGGGNRDRSGHCACAAGWAGALCGEVLPPPVAALLPGVSREQHDRAVAAGVDPAADAVCFTAAFLTVPDDANLLASAGQAGWADWDNYDPRMPSSIRCDAPEGTDLDSWATQGHGPFGLRHISTNGTGWYRLPAGKGLPTAPPGEYHCGTPQTGWLTGWPAGADTHLGWASRAPGTERNRDYAAGFDAGQPGQPSYHYATPADGSLPPPVGSPPVAGTVCFGAERGFTCQCSRRVRAVSCGAFALWELPPVGGCRRDCSGYCLAPDPCADCAAAGRCAAESWAGYPPETTCVNDDSTKNGNQESCSSRWPSDPEDCGQNDDDDFTAATQCCACGGGIDFTPGHCACAAGWAGARCNQRTTG
jgi:hypothetical protein